MTSPTKTWKRKGNFENGIPFDKYQFSKHLKRLGDWVLTEALSEEDFHRIRKAAYIWAFRHHCKISVRKYRVTGGWGVKITVVRNHY